VPTPPPRLHRVHGGLGYGGDEHPLKVGLPALNLI
jgi:hypothetical protein